MFLNIRLIDSNLETDVNLEKTLIEDNYCWSGYPSGYSCDEYKISFKVSSNHQLIESRIGNKISKDGIESQFLSKYLDHLDDENRNQITGIEEVSEDKDFESDPKPYDPELIRVETKAMSIKYIYEMMSNDEKDLDLSPDFQRNVVWTEIKQKSRMIESILLRIPLPVFYFSQDDEGKLHVVDGVQRLSVIKDYLENRFKLKNLEYLKDCEKKYYGGDKEKFDKNDVLDPKYVRRINQTQLYCNIIDPTTPVNVKFEIFKRINTGGTPLNHQEIRNCAAKTHIRDFLTKLAKSHTFKSATDESVRSIRMEDQELIMRFIGFYYNRIINNPNTIYKGSTKNFLDLTLDILNTEDIGFLHKIESDFNNSMENSQFLFGKYAFRKCKTEHLKSDAKRQLINKSLFTSLSVLLSKYPYEIIRSKNTERALLIPFAKVLDDNDTFFDAITVGTNDPKKTEIVFKTVEKIIEENLILH